MTKKRIVVTGMGLVSSLGHDPDLFFQNLLAGKSGVHPITGFPVDQFTTRFAGEITDFDVGDYMEKKTARRVDKFISYGVVAAKKALEYGGIDKETLAKFDKTRCGVIIGSGMGGMELFATNVKTLLERGPSKLTPFLIPYIITNMAGALVGIDYEFLGPNYSISTACATANNSIIAAANHIYAGDADFMITGGAEAAIIPIGIGGFCALKALSERNDAPEKASRPWDRKRDGFVMGEGAGVIILEEREHALKRGAKIYAEYMGGGISCDGYHMTEPRQDGEGVAQCIRNALRQAQLKPSDIQYVNAHATSTPAGDMAEINAMKKIFENPEKIVINATKSMIGHCLGAAGGIEAIATIKAIQEGRVHPNLNLDDPEEGLAFYAPKQAEEHKIRYGISNSFGFGGHNATVIFGKHSL